MKAVNNYIVVQNEKAGPKKVGGLLITEDLDTDNRYARAKVVSIGNVVEGIKEKDVVYYDKHAGHDIRYEDAIYRVIRMGDVVLID
jgi:chaperonin GroES